MRKTRMTIQSSDRAELERRLTQVRRVLLLMTDTVRGTACNSRAILRNSFYISDDGVAEPTRTSRIFAFMKKRSPWDEQQMDRLRQHVASGGSLMRACVIFKRPMFQLRLKANELGCPFPTLRQGRGKTNVAASERIAAAGWSSQGPGQRSYPAQHQDRK